MEKINLSRQHLESISTMDLISLANEYGIDIPANLDRRFIIEELLDISLELDTTTPEELVENTSLDISQELPATYNETKINVILRNPAWIYVYWDIREADLHTIKNDFDFENLSLHIAFYDEIADEKASDFFDIQLEQDDREQSILLPSAKKALMAHLVYNSTEAKPKILASSPRIEIPQESETLVNIQPGKKIEMTELVELSGMTKLLHKHYNQHRQLFS